MGAEDTQFIVHLFHSRTLRFEVSHGLYFAVDEIEIISAHLFLSRAINQKA